MIDQQNDHPDPDPIRRCPECGGETPEPEHVLVEDVLVCAECSHKGHLDILPGEVIGVDEGFTDENDLWGEGDLLFGSDDDKSEET